MQHCPFFNELIMQFYSHKSHHFPDFSRKLVVAIIIAGGVYLGGYAALYRVSQHHELNKKAQTLLAGTNRTFTLDSNISRQLFPRPTIILRNVKLSEVNSSETALAVDEIRVGVAWSSLFSNPTVEKLVFERAKGQITRQINQPWSISDLWKTRGERKIQFNRVQINNSELIIKDEQMGELKFDNVNLMMSRNGEMLPYVLTANANSNYWESLNLTASGNAQSSQDSLKLPDLKIKFNGKENSYTFSGSLKTKAAWQEQDFIAENTHIEAISKRYDSTLNLNIGSLKSRYGDATLGNINAVFTAPSNPYTPTGTLTANQATWRDYRFYSDELNLKINTHHQENDHFDTNLKTNAVWSMANGLQLHNAKFSSLYTPIQDPTKVRFASEWEGSFNAPSLTEWQLNAEGVFDRQPVTFNIERKKNNVSGSLKLAKLSLNNYLSSVSTPTQLPFPSPKLNVKMAWDIGTLETPTAQMDNFHADVKANEKQIELNPLSADLYNGHSTGSLKISNQTPLKYSLKQTATDVEIRPLLQDMFGIGSLSGKGTADFTLSAAGNTHDELIQNTNGKVSLDVKDGEWSGINLARVQSLLTGNILKDKDSEEAQSMPFSHFVSQSEIKNGISKHQANAELTQPAANMQSQGELNLLKETVNERIVFQGAGGDTPLPIRVNGDVKKPTISLDYQQLTAGASSPEEKQKAISDTLKNQWQWLLKKAK